jgi:hypothetical protein
MLELQTQGAAPDWIEPPTTRNLLRPNCRMRHLHQSLKVPLDGLSVRTPAGNAWAHQEVDCASAAVPCNLGIRIERRRSHLSHPCQSTSFSNWKSKFGLQSQHLQSADHPAAARIGMALPIQRSLMFAAVVCAGLLGCGRPDATRSTPVVAPASFGLIDEARLLAADREPDEWFAPGRDAGGSYYSPLADISDKTVEHLGFAWDYALGTKRGLEATPIVIDGVLYTSGNWGRVYALNAATGRSLWTYDPGAAGQWGRYDCCDVVNRGVAVRDSRVYVGSEPGFEVDQLISRRPLESLLALGNRAAECVIS